MTPFEPTASASSQPHNGPLRDKSASKLVGDVASATIGIAGGRLAVGGYRLDIPPGAVLLPTQFSMTLDTTLLAGGGASLEVELLATRTLPIVGLVDVGVLGFEKRVKLTMSYKRTGLTNPTNLRIALRNPDGSLTPLSSKVNTSAQTVTAQLRHFSRYCMVSD